MHCLQGECQYDRDARSDRLEATLAVDPAVGDALSTVVFRDDACTIACDSRLDPLHGGDAVDCSIERCEPTDAGALRARHQIRLREVETVDLIHLDGTK